MEKGIAALLARLRPRLKRILVRYRIPVADAEDLLQNACLTLVQSWERIENPAAWLVGTLRLMCVDYHRKRRRGIRLQACDVRFLAELVPPQPPPQREAEIFWDLYVLTGVLSHRLQRIVHLRYRLGLSVAEIAALLGYRPSSVRQLSSRALARMRRAYG